MSESTRTSRPLPRHTVPILAAVLVVALAAVVAGQLWLRTDGASDDRRADVRDAADRAVALVLSYDYRRLDAGQDATLPLLTGDARKQYEEVQAPLAETAPGLEAVVSAEVKASTVLEHDDDSARVLLFVDQTSTSTKLAQPQLDQSRVVVTLTRDGSGWLVSTLAAV